MNHLIWVGGGISYRISNDPGIESAIPDFIIRTESAKNDLFSKFRLHSLYASICLPGIFPGMMSEHLITPL